MDCRLRSCHRQRGAAATEFAFISIFFFAMVIGVIEFARLMYVYATAVEATRMGARMAVVCSKTDEAKVKSAMKKMLGSLNASNIVISYPATSNCSATDCDPVTVSIQNLTVNLAIPLVPLTMPVPAFSTSLPAESLDSTNNARCN